METNIDVVMARLEPYLELFDTILRHGHSQYEQYPASLVVDHDASTQAHCTNRHIIVEAHNVLDDLPLVRHIEVRQQNLWLFESANSVVRFKKTDEVGISSNYPTSQATAFDDGEELPGLPVAPTRLTVGYLLDETGIGYMRSQVSLPTKRGAIWCAAIIPSHSREANEGAWYPVTKQLSSPI